MLNPAIRKFIFVLLLTRCGYQACAQENDSLPIEHRETPFLVWAFNPSAFAPGIKVEFPHKHWAFGTHLRLHWVLATGGKIEPFARFYFKQAPEKWYLQGKLTAGEYYSWFSGAGLFGSNNTGYTGWYTSLGGGLAFGHQWILPKQDNLVLDLTIGVQFSVPVTATNLETIIIHYYLPALPLEIGFRIGGIAMKRSRRLVY